MSLSTDEQKANLRMSTFKTYDEKIIFTENESKYRDVNKRVALGRFSSMLSGETPTEPTKSGNVLRIKHRQEARDFFLNEYAYFNYVDE